MKQIVLVGSMGGTDLNHPLNALGNGNILVRRLVQLLIYPISPFVAFQSCTFGDHFGLFIYEATLIFLVIYVFLLKFSWLVIIR